MSENFFLTSNNSILSQFFSSTVTNRYDIKTENVEGLRIIQNNFDDYTSLFTSIDMTSSGTGKIMIAKNTFTNYITPTNGIGIKLNGNFTDTRITCNFFNNLTNIMNISSGSTLGDQVRDPITLNGYVPRKPLAFCLLPKYKFKRNQKRILK